LTYLTLTVTQNKT